MRVINSRELYKQAQSPCLVKLILAKSQILKMFEHHKVIVIGASFNGVVATKTYLQIDPSVDIIVIDGGNSLGGVWSSSRIYPGLMYEMPSPMLNFSDFDMCKELGIQEWEDVTRYQVNDFLERYARKHDILWKCRFNTNVDSVQRNGPGWQISVHATGNKSAQRKIITCDKLIVATGITSKPRYPDYDMSKFDGISFQSIEMGNRHEELVADSVKHVTIIGGHKSALEGVGLCSQAGKNVEWLVKASGGGPTWMMPARDPKGNPMAKMSVKRAMGVISTSVYHSDRWIDRFFHSGRWWLGTWLLRWVWGVITKQIQGDKYTKSENGHKLKPNPEFLLVRSRWNCSPRSRH